MLVLSRKLQQKIKIGPDVTVTVLSIHKSAVKLGIEAPPSTVVFRPEAKNRELWERKGTQ